MRRLRCGSNSGMFGGASLSSVVAESPHHTQSSCMKIIRTIKTVLFAAGVSLMAYGTTASAADYGLSFSDPVGDANGSGSPSGTVDLIGMEFSFDPITGAYHARLYADPTFPFHDSLYINLGLLNTDRAAAQLGGSFFFRTMHPVQVVAPTTVLDLFGTDSILTGWQPGERITPGRVPDPGPYPLFPTDFTTIRVVPISVGFPLYDNMANDRAAMLVVVPEPSSALLLVAGLSLFLLKRRLK